MGRSSYQKQRDEFITRVTRMGVSTDTARLILRHANTIQRLAVRECNGDDWQSGDLVTCPRAKDGAGLRDVVRDGTPTKWCPTCSETGTHGKVSRSSVKSDQVEARIRTLLAGSKLIAECGGDPRGDCVKLYDYKSKPADRESGRAQRIGVPTRCY